MRNRSLSRVCGRAIETSGAPSTVHTTETKRQCRMPRAELMCSPYTMSGSPCHEPTEPPQASAWLHEDSGIAGNSVGGSLLSKGYASGSAVRGSVVIAHRPPHRLSPQRVTVEDRIVRLPRNRDSLGVSTLRRLNQSNCRRYQLRRLGGQLLLLRHAHIVGCHSSRQYELMAGTTITVLGLPAGKLGRGPRVRAQPHVSPRRRYAPATFGSEAGNVHLFDLLYPK